MSEQAKNDKESMICLTPKPSQSFSVYRIQWELKKITEKYLFDRKGVWRIEQKTKRRLFN